MHGIAEEGVMFLGIGPLIFDKISLGIESGRGMLSTSWPVRKQREGRCSAATHNFLFSCRLPVERFPLPLCLLLGNTHLPTGMPPHQSNLLMVTVDKAGCADKASKCLHFCLTRKRSSCGCYPESYRKPYLLGKAIFR